MSTQRIFSVEGTFNRAGYVVPSNIIKQVVTDLIDESACIPLGLIA